MKLTALNALIAAVEEGSLRAAARRLKLSQPAVTKMIRELEREVAAPVLQRSTGGVLPTQQGKVLYEHARRALRELDDAQVLIEQLGGHMVGDLVVAAVPMAVVTLLPEAMRTFAVECPGVQLCVREELYFGQLSLLREGAVDLAICPVPDSLAPGEFEIEHLQTLEMAVVARPGHPLARARHLRQLREAAWVFTSRLGKSSYARRLFEAAGLEPPEPRCIVNSTLALLSLVCQGDHIALMPLVLARHPTLSPHLSIIPLQEGPLTLPLGALTRREGMLKPALRQFMLHLHRAVGHASARW